MLTLAEPMIAELYYDPDCTPQQVGEVVSALNRWSDRTSNHVTHHRASERHGYYTTIVLELNEARESDAPRRLFYIPSRNVSKGGIGLLAPPIFIPRLVSDTTPLGRTETMFPLGADVKVWLSESSRAGSALCGTIVRRRPVHLGFFDIGIQFVSRLKSAVPEATPGGVRGAA